MHKPIVLGGLGCLLLLGVAQARMIAPPPVTLRAAAAEAVIVGKVMGFGDKLVAADMFKGDTRQMQIATIQVGETLLGKGTKQIKVGFFPPDTTGGGGGRPPIRRYPTAQLTVGQEACLFLTPHPTRKDVYVLNNYYDVLTKTGNPGFAREHAEVQRVARLLASPMKGLKAKEAEDRYETAALLITRYRRALPGARTEPVSGEESKLILEALAEADWDRPSPRFARLMPRMIFAQLGLTAKDGWEAPRDFRQFTAEAKKWLKAHAGTYRLTRNVRPDSGKDPEPGS